ncbi:MAG TPA: hypothetical protein DIV80_04375 [Synergistaceae bacterium]|nr:hypothetical protein [Synergistaceae bacterium]
MGSELSFPLLPNPYRIAFEDSEALFIFYYGHPGSAGSLPRKISRGDFLLLTLKALRVFSRLKMKKGERFHNGFGTNSPEDLVFRMAATLSGTPVTLNRQSDTAERAAYKVSVSGARLMLTDGSLDPSLVDAAPRRRNGQRATFSVFVDIWLKIDDQSREGSLLT